METCSSLSSATAATSPSSPGAGSYSIPGGDNSLKTDAPAEDAKFKENEKDLTITQHISQLLLIEDSTLDKVPHHLENILQSFDVSKSQPADLLIAVIYGIALECSFAAVEEVQKNLISLQCMSVLSTFHIQNVKQLSKMPENIYDANKMSYTLPLQLIFDETATPCILTGIVTGDYLILTLTPPVSIGSGKSICLSIGRYVLNSKGKPFASRFRKLAELSHKLRDEIFIPIRNNIIKRDGELLYPGLDGLPAELYFYLYAYLNKNCLNKVANVSKRLLNTVNYYKKTQIKKKVNK